MPKLTKKKIDDALEKAGGSWTRAAQMLSVPRTTLSSAANRLGVSRKPAEGLSIEGEGDGKLITSQTRTLRTLDEMLRETKVDSKVWEVNHYTVHKRDDPPNDLWHVKAWLRRRTPQVRGMEAILAELKKGGPKLPKLRRGKRRKGSKRALEVCILDPHLGLECFRPGADHAWNLDTCEQYYLRAISHLLNAASHYGPFEEIVWLFGNDYLHSDTVFHTTTAGTGQPEAVSWHTAYERGIKLAIAAGNAMAAAAPLRIVQISGNHDRLSTFTIGHVLDAYYHHNANVTVEVSPSPYKFWEFGVNLVGFDHGHQKNIARLASVMANECPAAWARTSVREWHLGDQHRRGSGRPTVLAEGGVNVELLAGLTPANEWSKIKTFNHQQRGAVAYVWDAKAGQVARLHWNLDLYTGKPMG